MRGAKMTRSSLTWVTALFGLFWGATSFADDERLPPKVQAVMFKKIFGFDRELESRDIKVAIVQADDSSAEAERMVAAFQDLSIEAKLVKGSTASLNDFTVA